MSWLPTKRGSWKSPPCLTQNRRPRSRERSPSHSDGLLHQHRERIRHFLHGAVMDIRERRRHVRIDVDLTEDVRPAANQDYELRFRVEVAREIVPDGAYVGNVLVLAGRDRGATYALPDGNTRV